MTLIHRFSIPLLAALLLGPGCGGTSLPQPADPERALEALRSALDAWQRGEAVDALVNQQPAIVVVDHDWQSGIRLARYELADEAEAAGADLRHEVTLWLEEARGKTAPKKAAYSIGTHPALTVVREDP